MSEEAAHRDAGARLGVVFEKHVEAGPLLQVVLKHQEALAAKQARLEAERDVLVRLFRLMHEDGVITVEYGAIGSEAWSESLSYDEDVVLRRILDANL